MMLAWFPDSFLPQSDMIALAAMFPMPDYPAHAGVDDGGWGIAAIFWW
tara:strand:+ start:2245 stop:2388 length:144 start_codon:yes stop_codon:yes gene_type:complete